MYALPARRSRSPWHTPAGDAGPPSGSADACCPDCLRPLACAAGLGPGLGPRPSPDGGPGGSMVGCARCAAHLAGPGKPGFGPDPGAWSLGRHSAHGAGAAPGATQRVLALTLPQGAPGKRDASPDADLKPTGPTAARPRTASQRLHRLARQGVLQPATQPRAALQAGSQEDDRICSSAPLPPGGRSPPPPRSASQPLPDKLPPPAPPLSPAPARPRPKLCSG